MSCTRALLACAVAVVVAAGAASTSASAATATSAGAPMVRTFDGAATSVTRLTASLAASFCLAENGVAAVPAGAVGWTGTVTSANHPPSRSQVGDETQGFYERVVVTGSAAKAAALFTRLRAAATACGPVGSALPAAGTDGGFSAVELPTATGTDFDGSGFVPTETSALSAVSDGLNGSTVVDVYRRGVSVVVVASNGVTIVPLGPCTGPVDQCGSQGSLWTVAQVTPNLERFAMSAVGLVPRVRTPLDAAGAAVLPSFDKDPTTVLESPVGDQGRFCDPGATSAVSPAGSKAASATLTASGRESTAPSGGETVTTTPFRNLSERVVVNGTVAQAEAVVRAMRSAVRACGTSPGPAVGVGKVSDSFSFTESVPAQSASVSATQASSTLVLGGADTRHAGATVLVDVFRLGPVVVVTAGDSGATEDRGVICTADGGFACPAVAILGTVWDPPSAVAFQLGRFSNSAVVRVRRQVKSAR